MRKQTDDGESDPHYREMLKVIIFWYTAYLAYFLPMWQYPDAPNSWYIVILIVSVITALVIIYKTDSTLPW